MTGRVAGLVVIGALGCGRVAFDATAGDGGVDGSDAPPADPCTGLLFCEAFDDGLGAWDGMTFSGQGARLDHEPAFGLRGGSVRATGPQGADRAVLYKDVFAGASDLWVRVQLFAPSGMLLDLEPVSLGDPAATNVVVFSLYDDGVDIHAHGLGGDFMQTVALTTPRDRWACYELHLELGAAGRVELFVDGNLVTSKGPFDTRPTTPIARLELGIASKPLNLTETVSADEVAAATTRIGCP